MNKEELELYDIVLNSEKSFDVNYKELAISLRAELELYKDNEEYLNNKIEKAIEYIKETKKEIIKDYDYGWKELIRFDGVIDILEGNNE